MSWMIVWAMLGCSTEVAPTEKVDKSLVWKGEIEDCGPGLSRSEADDSLALGRAFLLNNQLEAGNFGYEYDWKTKTDSTEDNEVRQAGATWGLALLLHDNPADTEVRDAVLRALAFWDTQAVVDGNRRYMLYQGAKKGGTGMLALTALAHIEVLRSGAELTEDQRAKLDKDLDGLLEMLKRQRHPKGGFHSYFSKEGRPHGSANPYADGEVVLAMVKAANYTGRTRLLDHAVPWVKADYRRNVVEARQKDADSDTTKGYYQWSSMTYHELSKSEAKSSGPWREWLMELAVWMIDTHRTLRRSRNTSYAYEGIIPAYEAAKEMGDPREKKFRCVIDQGMRKLTTWQVGHELAVDYLKSATPDDKRAWGGIQNIHNESPLRVDVTQHQMHAVILHRRYVVTP